MAKRLSCVIDDIVSMEQSAFLKGRQILDGPFILNETLSWCKKHKQKTMILKIDFQKTYDSVRWDLIDDILFRFGFGEKCRMWIQGCFSSCMGSVLVNGSLTAEFQFRRGLRQGYPSSPFLFLFVMESLHIAFMNVMEKRLFSPLVIGNGMKINLSHLFYANDAIFIGRWSSSNIIALV